MGNIKLLEKEFSGRGEVSGFEFCQIKQSVHSYVYKITDSDNKVHYEVFKRKNTPLCLDFEKKVFSDTEFKEVYPKSKDFGVWAWTFRSKFEALKRDIELNRIFTDQDKRITNSNR